MQIKAECSRVETGAGYRPGMMMVTMEKVTLQDFDSRELLGQMDIKDVMEWLNEQGYTSHGAAA